jgi:hypothetical protein
MMNEDLINCVVCGNVVNTIEDGNRDGCQLTDDTWVCSEECWDIAVEWFWFEEE